MAAARGAARHFGIGEATAIRRVREWRRTGSYEPAPFGKPPGSKLDAHEAYLIGLIEKTPDITLEEMRRRLADDHGMGAGIGTLWRVFGARGVSYKKRPGAPGGRHAQTSMRPGAWFEDQRGLAPERLIFIDETGLITKMDRLGGAPRVGVRAGTRRAAIGGPRPSLPGYVGQASARRCSAPATS